MCCLSVWFALHSIFLLCMILWKLDYTVSVSPFPFSNNKLQYLLKNKINFVKQSKQLSEMSTISLHMFIHCSLSIHISFWSFLFSTLFNSRMAVCLSMSKGEKRHSIIIAKQSVYLITKLIEKQKRIESVCSCW